MKTKNSTKTQIIMILIALVLLLNTGCGEGMKWRPVYDSAMFGALVGGIIGYQSDETEEGIALGASLFALGEVLKQSDEHPSPQKQSQQQPQKTVSEAKRPPVRESIKETYIIEIHNDNGSITPVEIRKDGDQYVGPTGEHYDKLPTEAQLKPFYGL